MRTTAPKTTGNGRVKLPKRGAIRETAASAIWIPAVIAIAGPAMKRAAWTTSPGSVSAYWNHASGRANAPGGIRAKLDANAPMTTRWAFKRKNAATNADDHNRPNPVVVVEEPAAGVRAFIEDRSAVADRRPDRELDDDRDGEFGRFEAAGAAVGRNHPHGERERDPDAYDRRDARM